MPSRALQTPGTPSWRRNLFAVTATSFAGSTGFTLVMPFLPLYIGQLGVSDVGAIAMWTGLSLGVTPAITAVLSPLWGRVGDAWGRKFLVERSLASFVLIMAATAFVTRPWHILALRALQGVFAGFAGLCLAMAAESAPRDRMAWAIGMVQTAQRLGPAIGPVVGGVIAGLAGLRNAFFVTSAFYAAAFFLVLFLYEERRQPGSSPRPAGAEGDRRQKSVVGGEVAGSGASDEGASTLPAALPSAPAGASEGPRAAGFSEILRLPNFALLMVVLFGLQFADRSFGPVLPLHVAALGVPAGRVAFVTGILFSILACSAAVGHHVCGRLIDRAGARRLIVTGATLCAAGAAVFVVSSHVALLAPALMVFGIGIGTASTAAYTSAGSRIPAASHGTGFGLLTGASLTGLAVTPMFVGFVATTASIRLVFALDVLALVVLAVTVNRRRSL